MKYTMIALLTLALSGCGIVQWAEDNEVAARLLTTQTTLRYIDAADDPKHRAQRVAQTASMISEVVDQGVVGTLAELETVAREAIDWDRLSIADQDLLDTAISLAAEELRSRSEAIGMDQDDVVRIKTLLEWISLAASRVM